MNINNIEPSKEVLLLTEQLKKNTYELNETIKNLRDSQISLSKALQQNAKDYKDNASNIKSNQEAIKKLNEEIESTSRVLKTTSATLSQNKELMSSLLTKYETLKITHADNSRAVRDMKLEIVNLTMVIDKQEKDLAKSSKTFDFQAKAVDALKLSFSTLKDNAGEFAPALEKVSTGFNAMKDGLSVAKTGFQSVGGAIKATGLGLLILMLESVTKWLTESAEGQKYFSGGLASIGKIVEIVEKVFVSLGGSIFKALIHPVDTVKSIWKNVITTLSNQFKPFGTMLEGFLTGNFSMIKEGYAQLKSNINTIATGAVKTFQNAKNGLFDFVGEITKAYNDGFNKKPDVPKPTTKHYKESVKEVVDLTKQAEEERLASIARMAKMTLQGYAKEIADANDHFKELKSKYNKFLDDYSKMDAKGKAAHKKEYDAVNATIEQQEIEHQATLNAITKRFQDEDVKKLDVYHKELNKIGKGARLLAIQQLNEDYNKQANELTALNKNNQQIATNIEAEILNLNIQKLSTSGQEQLNAIDKQLAELEKKRAEAQYIADDAKQMLAATTEKHHQDTKSTNKEFDQQDETKAEGKVQGEIGAAREGGHESAAIKKEIELLKMQHDFAEKRGEVTTAVEEKYIKKKIELENKLTQSRIHAGDKYIDAVLKNTKKDSAIYKAAFLAKKATAIADVITNAKSAIIASFVGYSSMPFIGQALAIAQGAFIAGQAAMSIADISKQKPGFAQGGQYVSDGRGALLSGYSRTDNTNAYLRSGEAVVVSEAMRNPWARNLVSAINVAHGGRDFSMPNPGRGYAIGGIFTDGGNANRYYSQPVNDQKDMANTLAYQLINNFPPIYVDVKDVNNQQNILAQTVDRVNL